jgi:predicted NAD-dependent protein-ADP-ribosyltransferase YbiA (DUF1768 family)
LSQMTYGDKGILSLDSFNQENKNMKMLLLLMVICSCATKTKYPTHWWDAVDEKDAASWEILPQAAGKNEVILSKRHELGILSNFAPTPFWLHGKRYASVEGFWQMMKYPETKNDPWHAWQLPYTREQVAGMSGFEAKAAGDLAEAMMKKHNVDWVSYDGQRMTYCSPIPKEHHRLIKEAMMKKLRYNQEVKRILLATNDLKLKPDHHAEACPAPEWKYYELWMEIRRELQHSLWPARFMLISP